MTVGGYVMRPQSRGTIHVKTPDFRDAPAIVPNFLSAEADCRAQVAGLRWARRVMHSPVLEPYFEHELTPGAILQTDEELLAFPPAITRLRPARWAPRKGRWSRASSRSTGWKGCG